MWVCRGPCGVIGGSAQQQCWVTVSIWGVSLWGECGSDPLFLGALCWISVCIWGVPLWGECGSVKVSVGLLGALCWITVGIWGSLSGVSVGLTHSSRAPPSLSSLHLTAGEGRDSPRQASCCSVCPFCVMSPDGHLSSSSPNSALTSWCL